MPLAILSVTPTDPAPGDTVTVTGTCDDCPSLILSAKKGTASIPVTLIQCEDGVWSCKFEAPECDPPPPVVSFFADDGGTPASTPIPLDCPS